MDTITSLKRATQRSFGYQWTQFADMVEANREHFLTYIAPIEPSFFKGKFGLEFLNQASRLRQPLVRHDDELVATSWEEALDHIASRLAGYRGDSFALLTSPNSTNEEHYLAQKFARLVMGANNVDQTSNLQPELVAGLQEALGYAAGTNPIWDLEQAGCILVFNANLTEEHNVAGVPIKRAARANAKLVVIDPREV